MRSWRPHSNETGTPIRRRSAPSTRAFPAASTWFIARLDARSPSLLEVVRREGGEPFWGAATRAVEVEQREALEPLLGSVRSVAGRTGPRSPSAGPASDSARPRARRARPGARGPAAPDAANRAARLPSNEWATTIGGCGHVAFTNASNQRPNDSASKPATGSDSPSPGTSGASTRWRSASGAITGAQ